MGGWERRYRGARIAQLVLVGCWLAGCATAPNRPVRRGKNRWRPPELTVAKGKLASFEELKRIALSYLGRPYKMGGVGTPAFDCSGFVCRVFAEGGYALPRVSRDQAHAGSRASLKALAPGDLLFFSPSGDRISHVGIYLGNGELVHASSGQGEVTVADLGDRWFRESLVDARRVLTSSTSTAAFEPAPSAPVRELVEHTTGLPLTLRRPATEDAPEFGPRLAPHGSTWLGMRSGLVTERGILGVTLSPEAALYLRSIALEIAVAVPIRFELNSSPTLGPFERFGHYLRFLRTLALGVKNADLELRFSRTGDYSLLSGGVIDRLTPGAMASGVAGLSVVRTPLSFHGRYRHRRFSLSALIDDVGQPEIIGAGLQLHVPELLSSIGLGYSTDQGGRLQDAKRAINAAEVELVVRPFKRHRWFSRVLVQGALLRALDQTSAGVLGALEGGYRGRHLGVRGLFSAGYAGAGYVERLFSPTYYASRQAHMTSLGNSGARAVMFGSLSVRYQRLRFSLGYGDGLSGRDRLDRRIEGSVELKDLSLGGPRYLDVRVAYSGRGLMTVGEDLHSLQGNIRLRLYSWLFAELYLAKSRNFEGGGGVTIAWVP